MTRGPCDSEGLGVSDIESVMNKSGNEPSEKRCVPVCRFCENPFQAGPNVIQAVHGVHGTGKKKAVKLCKSTPADVKARLQQEIDVQHWHVAQAACQRASTLAPARAKRPRRRRPGAPSAIKLKVQRRTSAPGQ